MDISLSLNLDKFMADILYKIRMYTHKIEKAISMPDRWPVFAQNDVRELVRLCERRCEDVCLDEVTEAYRTIHKYFNCLNYSYKENCDFLNEFRQTLKEYGFVKSFSLVPQKDFDLFEKIMIQRKSIRNFSTKKVPLKTLKKAIQLAHMMPSACNRQPCDFVWIKDSAKREQLLQVHCGNKGFSAPVLGVIIADKKAFFQENEEMSPYYHGGLFSGGLILALESLNLSSCLLNWNVSKDDDEKTMSLLGFNSNLIITNLIFIGYKKENVLEAHSPRKTKNILNII